MTFFGGEVFLCCRRTDREALWTRWDHHHVHHSSSQPSVVPQPVRQSGFLCLWEQSQQQTQENTQGQKEDDWWTKLTSLYAKYLCSPKETSLNQQTCLTLTQHQGLFSYFFYLFFFSQQTFQTPSRWLEDKYL